METGGLVPELESQAWRLLESPFTIPRFREIPLLSRVLMWDGSRNASPTSQAGQKGELRSSPEPRRRLGKPGPVPVLGPERGFQKGP